MKRLITAALLSSAVLAAFAQANPKKDLVQKLLVLQQPGIEQVARSLVERPAVQMMQEVAMVLQRQVPPEKREALGKQVETEIKKYVEEALPVVKERAVKLAPTTIGPILEEKFSEEELKGLIAWFESPLNKKYSQLGPEMQNAFVQKLVVDARPVVDPKLQALDVKVRSTLGLPPPGAAAASAAPAPRASSGAAKNTTK